MCVLIGFSITYVFPYQDLYRKLYTTLCYLRSLILSIISYTIYFYIPGMPAGIDLIRDLFYKRHACVLYLSEAFVRQFN